MESVPKVTTEAECRELLDRYPENVFLQDRLATILRSQGREQEANEVLPVEPICSFKYYEELLRYDERIRQRPDDWATYVNRGIGHHWELQYGKALADFDTAITINPRIAYAFCSRASLRATCPDDGIRDAPRRSRTRGLA